MTITLTCHPAGHCWVAHFSEPLEALGTDVVPTPFTEYAPASVVLAEIQRRNPGDTVVLADPV